MDNERDIDAEIPDVDDAETSHVDDEETPQVDLQALADALDDELESPASEKQNVSRAISEDSEIYILALMQETDLGGIVEKKKSMQSKDSNDNELRTNSTTAKGKGPVTRSSTRATGVRLFKSQSVTSRTAAASRAVSIADPSSCPEFGSQEGCSKSAEVEDGVEGLINHSPPEPSAVD